MNHFIQSVKDTLPKTVLVVIHYCQNYTKRYMIKGKEAKGTNKIWEVSVFFFCGVYSNIMVSHIKGMHNEH